MRPDSWRQSSASWWITSAGSRRWPAAPSSPSSAPCCGCLSACVPRLLLLPGEDQRNRLGQAELTPLAGQLVAGQVARVLRPGARDAEGEFRAHDSRLGDGNVQGLLVRAVEET